MGIALLAELHRQGACTEFVVKLCKGGRSEYSARKMNDELTRVLALMEKGELKPLARTMVPKVVVQRAGQQQGAPVYEPAPVQDKVVDWTKLPEDLRLLDARIKSLYSHNKTIRGQLRELTYTADGRPRGERSMRSTRQRRQELCFLAVGNQQEINAMWARVDYYRQHNMYKPGTEPQEQEARIKEWLRQQPQMVNYTRQEDTYFRKNNKYRNEVRYNEYKAALEAIKNYVEGTV